MKIERFKYHEKFCVKSTFLDTSIDVEGTIDPGETLKEAVTKAREEIIKSLPKHVSIVSQWDANYIPPESTLTTTSIPTISLDKERLEILQDNIRDAQSLEELQKLKEDAGKAGLVSEYMDKMNKLLTVPKNFTDGLE